MRGPAGGGSPAHDAFGFRSDRKLCCFSRSFLAECLLFCPFGNRDSLRNVFSKIEQELNLGLLIFIHVVVNIYVGPKLETISDYLLSALSERSFHVIVGSESKSAPEGILNAALGDSHGVIHTISATFLVSLILSPQSRSHLSGKNVQWVYLWQFEQSPCYGPFNCLAGAGGSMLLLAVVVMPSAL